MLFFGQLWPNSPVAFCGKTPILHTEAVAVPFRSFSPACQRDPPLSAVACLSLAGSPFSVDAGGGLW